jgi:penicillin-binding protein 1C
MNTRQAYYLRQRGKKNPRASVRWFGALVLAVILGAFGVLALGVSGVVATYVYFSQQLPSGEEISQMTISSFESTRIYDRTGTHLLYELMPPEGGTRTMVPLYKIPEHMRYATIAMEDRTFYENPGGINLVGIVRAAVNNLRGEPVQGATSIAQGLVKNVVMTPEERYEISYTRKVKEVILALELTRRYPGLEGKDKILEGYLNTVFYGRWAYGVEAAANSYFGKSAEELTLAESAMLVPIPQSPVLNPIDNPSEAKRRQEIVLDQMYMQGYISAEQAWEAKQEELNIVSKRFDILAPHFVMYVRSLLESKFGTEAVYRGGMQVITTLDLDLQNEVERVAREQIAKVQEKHKVENAAVVVIDPTTGEILSMLGSVDYFNAEIKGQVNVAISDRQPGSSFKPFTYVTAFAQGYTPATMVMDVRTSFPDDPNPPYVPENHDRKFHGPLLLRTALACSYNVPAVAMLHKAGVKNVLETAHRMGINSLNRDFYGLSLTLGGGEVKLLDLTYAYAVFANNGVMIGEPVPEQRVKPGFRELDPVAVLKIVDTGGNLVYEYAEPQRRDVIAPELAYLITDILSDNRARTPTFGPSSVINVGSHVAVKTGTTTDYRDAWTVGYSTQAVVGVWLGNSDNVPMENMPGSAGAGPVWRGVMDYLLQDKPVIKFPQPDGLVRVRVDSASGLLPTQYSPRTVEEVFVAGTEPQERDNIHRPFRVCLVSGGLATSYCPPETTEVKVFDVYPVEANDYVRENGIPQAPASYCDAHGPSATTLEVAISVPALNGYVAGVVPIIGNARPGDFRHYQLRFGRGINPGEWMPIGGEHYDRVHNDILEYWDVSQVPDGLYTLQLVVTEGSGNVRAATVPVVVDNKAPRLQIIHPPDDAVYIRETDEWVNIQVDALDNYAMDRVEFFLDGEPIGYSTVAPFTLKWTMSPSEGITETHSLHVVGYDKAGNHTESEPVRIYTIHKPKQTEPMPTPVAYVPVHPVVWLSLFDRSTRLTGDRFATVG